MLTVEYLRSRLSYDPDTGEFRWIGWANGKKAGCVNKALGYTVVGLDRTPQYAHRLAWLYMTGEWPAEEVDHINGQRSDNRWTNLRAATRQQQQFNMPAHQDSRHGTKGVHLYKEKYWCAKIRINGRQTHIGTFKTKEAAEEAYNKAAAEHQKEFAVSNRPKTKE